MATALSDYQFSSFIDDEISNLFQELGDIGIDLGKDDNTKGLLKQLKEKLANKNAKLGEVKSELSKFKGTVRKAKKQRERILNRLSRKNFNGKSFDELGPEKKKQIRQEFKSNSKFEGKGDVKGAQLSKVKQTIQERKNFKNELAQQQYGKNFNDLTNRQKNQIKNSDVYKNRDVGRVKQVRQEREGLVGKKQNLKGQIGDIESQIRAEKDRRQQRTPREVLEEEINAFISGQRGLGEKAINAGFRIGLSNIEQDLLNAQRQNALNFATRGLSSSGVRSNLRLREANRLNTIADESVGDLVNQLTLQQRQSKDEARRFGVESLQGLTSNDISAEQARQQFEANKKIFEADLASQRNLLNQNLAYTDVLSKLRQNFETTNPIQDQKTGKIQ